MNIVIDIGTIVTIIGTAFSVLLIVNRMNKNLINSIAQVISVAVDRQELHDEHKHRINRIEQSNVELHNKVERNEDKSSKELSLIHKRLDDIYSIVAKK